MLSLFFLTFCMDSIANVLEKENQVLREKNLELSLQVESMLNLQNENNALMEMLEFKKNKKFIIKSAKLLIKDSTKSSFYYNR